MIVFDLACQCGYQFEGWFHDSSDFQLQLTSGLIFCPVCNGSHIRKILSAVAVHTSRDLSDTTQANQQILSEAEVAQRALHVVQKFVEQNFDDVGTEFTEQALKMHFGASTPRNIRGVATSAEEEILKKEGIELLKVPMPIKKEDEN